MLSPISLRFKILVLIFVPLILQLALLAVVANLQNHLVEKYIESTKRKWLVAVYGLLKTAKNNCSFICLAIAKRNNFSGSWPSI